MPFSAAAIDLVRAYSQFGRLPTLSQCVVIVAGGVDIGNQVEDFVAVFTYRQLSTANSVGKSISSDLR